MTGKKEVFVYAFGEAGSRAVRLLYPRHGYERKGLIDQNPDPTRDEAAFAIPRQYLPLYRI